MRVVYVIKWKWKCVEPSENPNGILELPSCTLNNYIFIHMNVSNRIHKWGVM